MNKRIRKKQLKRIGKYIPSSDTWNVVAWMPLPKPYKQKED